MSTRVTIIDRVILAIGEHVGAKEAVDIGGGEGIGVYESTDRGVVITALEIIEVGLLRWRLAMVMRFRFF